MTSGNMIINAIRELAEEPMPARRVEILQSLVDAGLEKQLTGDLREAIAVLRIFRLIEPPSKPDRPINTNKNFKPPRSSKPDFPTPKMGSPCTRAPKTN